MNDSQIVTFAVIAGLLTITPGVDTMLVIRNVLARGRLAGLQTTAGICCGLFVHATLSALGLSLILVGSAAAFDAVRMIGAAYLIWLGIQAVRQALVREPGGAVRGSTAMAAARRTARARTSFLEGFLSNTLNPKVAVFYLAFLPQFMSAGDRVFAKSMLLATIHFVEGVVWLSALSFFVARLQAWIGQSRVKRTIEATAGIVLIGFGARLALERGR